MSVKMATLSKHVAIFRVIFGAIWAIDAIFKWQPAFSQGFSAMIASAAQDQPSWLNPWFHFWLHFLSLNPHLFATITAIIESLIALALLFGLARRATYISGAVFSLLVWGVAEGFGGPYTIGSTDIGTAIMYAVVFFALYGLDQMTIPPKWSIDNYLTKRIPWWSIIANP